MASKIEFNPFTGQLDYLGQGGTPLPGENLYSRTFNIANWGTPSAGYYSLLVTHNLNRSYIEVDVWDIGNYQVIVDRQIIDNNNILLKVEANPDCRFSGTVYIKNI